MGWQGLQSLHAAAVLGKGPAKPQQGNRYHHSSAGHHLPKALQGLGKAVGIPEVPTAETTTGAYIWVWGRCCRNQGDTAHAEVV